MEHIGIVGLGRMGSAIAQRMTAQTQGGICGWTRSGRPVDGVETTADLASLVSASDTLVLSLYDDAAVAEILDQLLTFDLIGKLIIDTSTVSPNVLQDRAAQIVAKGAAATDAPISGGPEMVLAGQCGVFIGGTDSDAARAQSVLRQISERIFHVGPLGAGLAMKIINNGMLQVYVAGLAEMLPFARKTGLPLETVLKILGGGPAGLPMITARIPKILGDDPEVGFAMSGTFKDNAIFREVVAAHGIPTDVIGAYGRHKAQMAADGRLEEDPAALIRWFYREAE